MTRLFTDGAEMGDNFYWTGSDGASTEFPRTGAYAYRFYNSREAYRSLPDLVEFYTRDAAASSNGVFTSNTISTFRHDTTTLFTEGVDSNNKVTLSMAGGSTFTSTESILPSINLWHVFETYIKISDGGHITVKCDGLVMIDYSGDTLLTANDHINRFYIHAIGTVGHHDDIALNDTNGTEDNSGCGDGRVYKITPSGSSATTNNWVNSGSVSGSANYLYVDDFPKDDDTTYVYCSGSNSGNQDQYAMSNLSLSPSSQISRIWTEARAKKANSDDTYIKIGFLPNGGTDSLSGSIALSTTNYTAVSGCVVTINPYTSLPWTKADLDGLESIVEME